MLIKISNENKTIQSINPEHVVRVYNWTDGGELLGSIIKLTDGNTIRIKRTVEYVTDALNRKFLSEPVKPKLITLTDLNGDGIGIDPSLVRTVYWNLENIKVEFGKGGHMLIKGPRERVQEVINKVNGVEEPEQKVSEPIGRELEI